MGDDGDLNFHFDFVLPLIKDAGKIIKEAKEIVLERKEEIWDLVTVYDRKIEAILVRKLKDKFPHHKFIGEEESAMVGSIPELTNDPTWIIDPIDGTANFVRRFPVTCISVALVIGKEPMIGIVYNPFLDELFTAIKGKGAFRNGKKIYTRKVKNIMETNLNYELSVARAEVFRDLYLYRFKHLISTIEGVRSLGSAALGLCYVACGFNDAYQCDGLKPWDAAAGVLIVREAGGYVCDSSDRRLGEEFELMDPNFLAAANKELAEQYVEIERQADAERRTNLSKVQN